VPQTIVFDTNYFRSFGPLEYLAGRLPQKIAGQVNLAFQRGDLVALVDTVRTETNAWLAEELEKSQKALTRALRTLTDAGFTVTPAIVNEKTAPDIAAIMNASNANVPVLMPTVEDYREAERRTSNRLPPLPKKSDSEEMRDRVIWCQLLRYSEQGQRPVLIVSGDALFLNGASSEEGKHSCIRRVEGETDLDQHLGERPLHIQEVANRLLHFASALRGSGIALTAANILGIEELRNVRQADGSITQRFSLITSPDSGLPSTSPVTLTGTGDEPISIAIGSAVIICPPTATSGMDNARMARDQSLYEQQRAAEELRRLMGSDS